MEQPEKEFRDQLTEFFDHYNLEESKNTLWSWLRTTVTGNFGELTTVEKDNIMTFYEQLNKFLPSADAIRRNLEKHQGPTV